MKKMGIMRATSIIVAVLVMSILTAGRAYSWDPATHAYIEEHLFKKKGQLSDEALYNRLYGSNALDMFNNNFTSPYLEFAAYLHHPTRENFLKVWQAATTKDEKASAYGIVGHNNIWGMDSTAHISGITFGKGEGYVIAKANILAFLLKPFLEEQLGPEIHLDYAVVVDICHYFVESGVDFLVREMDPSIGQKLMHAAINRSDETPELLARAFKTDFSVIAGIPEENAAQLIRNAEGMFRTTMMNYGWALTQENALDLISVEMARVGAAYLNLPPGSEAALVPAVQQGILAAMLLCEPDFERELKASTGWVNGKLSSHGISW